jgi:hypothetical protein
MKLISVDINVEEMPLAEPIMSIRLNLCGIYLRMAWRGLQGVISKVKVSPVYGSDEKQEPDLEAEEPVATIEEVANAFSKVKK